MRLPEKLAAPNAVKDVSVAGAKPTLTQHTMRRHGLWRHRDFLLLWSAQVISAVGSRRRALADADSAARMNSRPQRINDDHL